MVRKCVFQIDFKIIVSRRSEYLTFELIEEVWMENGGPLGERVEHFESGGKCKKISYSGGSVDVEELETDHEEANTKIAYLIQHAAKSSDGQQIICVVELR